MWEKTHIRHYIGHNASLLQKILNKLTGQPNELRGGICVPNLESEYMRYCLFKNTSFLVLPIEKT